MNRTQLEHVLRAAADVVGVIDLVVLGSQAILGSYENWQLPEEATRSTEADVAVDASVARVEVGADESALADLIDGALGEGSQFHAAFGYYAQGVETATAILTTGWRDRLVPVICDARDNTGVAAVGWCLETNDLWVAKAAAGRPKDFEFCRALAARGLVSREICLQRMTELSGVAAAHANAAAARSFA